MTNRKKRSVDRSNRVEVKLTDDEYQELEQLAFEDDTSLSTIIRQALKHYRRFKRR